MKLANLPSPIKQLLKPVQQSLRHAEFLLRDRLKLFQDEGTLIRDAHQFWNEPGPGVHRHAHWREAFSEEKQWLALGAEHLQMFEEFARLVKASPEPRRIVEWGCGGGANAIHFAPRAGQYIGVDVSQASLDECARQLANAGFRNFKPALIDTAEPEQFKAHVDAPCDLFLSTYVFELLPTPEYGLRVLSLAHEVLAPDGIAIIQIRFKTQSWQSKPKRFAYRYNFVTMTSFRIDEFWIEAERRGFKAKAVRLVLRQPLVGDGNYAYFLLQR